MILAENPQNMSSAGYERLLSTFLSGRSKKTRRAYLSDLKTLAEFLGAHSMTDALRFFLSGGQQYANHIALEFKNELLEKKKNAPATINRKLATLRSLTKMARMIGLLSWHLTAENLRNELYRDTSGPGKDVIRQLLSLFNGKTDPKSLRDLAILRLLYDIGLRREEISQIDYDDLLAGKIQVLGKGKRSKVAMSLPPVTERALASWITARGTAGGALFTNFDRAGKGNRLTGNSIYRNLMSLSRKIGKEVRPHQIRHTSITQACTRTYQKLR